LLCGTSCVNQMTDPDNCGTCGRGRNLHQCGSL
jgi:hypothetical protein